MTRRREEGGASFHSKGSWEQGWTHGEKGDLPERVFRDLAATYKGNRALLQPCLEDQPAGSYSIELPLMAASGVAHTDYQLAIRAVSPRGGTVSCGITTST